MGYGDRVVLAHLPTPLEAADRLGAAIGMPAGSLWVKRDDATGLAAGGNKVRKLEYLMAEAAAGGHDMVVTGGGPQSNHVRATAAAATRCGLGCAAVLAGDRPAVPGGNVVLDRLLGADLVWAGDLSTAELEEAIAAEVERRRSAGRRPLLIPVGGASVTGTLGYVRAADELAGQMPDLDLVVVAAGSGGTQAGLAAGFGDHGGVLGVDVGVRPGPGEMEDFVTRLAGAAADASGRPPPVGTCVVDHDHAGPRYRAPTAAARAALDLAARTEGLILDPVYTGKALAALCTRVRDGRVAPGTRVVFLHSGGMPALFVSPYPAWIDAGVAAP